MASPLSAQQAEKGAAGLQDVGAQAIRAMLKQSLLDSTVVVEKTGKSLPSNGAWSVGKDAPSSCPQTSDACVRILYQVSEDGVSCNWVVQLIGDGNDGVILEQNKDATRYFLRRLTTSQAADIVLTRKQPIYPPLAAAAHLNGSVVVRAVVSSSGAIEKALIVSGPEMLRTSSIDAIRGWSFKPLMVGTEPVRFETDVTFDYKTMGPSSSGRVTSNP
ncbi:TonB family protein [Edaphobacter lichenicola]|uniref:TonB family protein n=2 Tax=Tunturiibacter TaxID=3154218 RepID=A0A852VCD3_9BACT|nr:TonB family protein [Edaphobacter lichenicola]